MPKIQINGVNLYYEEHGSGSETIVFGHGYLTNASVFKEQINSLKKDFRCIAFDFRGQGKSQVAFNGYDMENLANDTAKLIQKLHANPCHYVGLSMGGNVGLRLAMRYSHLLVSLTLIDASAEAMSLKQYSKYAALNLVGRSLGLKPIMKQAMPIVFSRHFLNDPSKIKIKEKWQDQISEMDKKGLSRMLMGILKRESIEEKLPQITMPTLILVGEKDIAASPARAHNIHQHLPDSKLIEIPNVGHCAPVESPKIVTKALREFYDELHAFTI